MFSLFPSLLSFEEISPLLLRVTLGLVLILWGYRKLVKKNNSDRATGGIHSVIGAFFILGLLTQLMALISTIYFGVLIYGKIKDKSFLTDGVNYYFILFIISISLIFTGAGLLALDLHL